MKYYPTVVLLAVTLGIFSPPEPGATRQASGVRALLSIAEVQQMIVDRGYKIKVDGMVCAACYAEGHSETQENWDLAINDQCALETWPK